MTLLPDSLPAQLLACATLAPQTTPDFQERRADFWLMNPKRIRSALQDLALAGYLQPGPPVRGVCSRPIRTYTLTRAGEAALDALHREAA